MRPTSRIAAAIIAVMLASSSSAQMPDARQVVLLPRVATPEASDQLMNAGLLAFERGDHAEARRLFRKLAQRQIPAAETLLGTMAANGQGGPQNDAIAAAWFMRAARRGYAPAQLALADSFARGRGVKQSRQRALELAQQAAAQRQAERVQLVSRQHGVRPAAFVEASSR